MRLNNQLNEWHIRSFLLVCLNRKMILALVFLFQVLIVFSQNIYDYQHSKKYSQYLFDTKQYSLASEEMERVLFYNHDNDSIKFQLIRSYLLGNQFDIATKRLDSLFPDHKAMPENYSLEYSKALISLNAFDQAFTFIQVNRNLTVKDKLYLNLNAQLLDYKWEDAKGTFVQIQSQKIDLDKRYADLFSRINSTTYKSPGLALALSAVIPGLGKVYTNNWKDGIISFIFVGGNAIQAVRGFRKYGNGSAFFIVYASVATSFYLGNLYGSYKSANKFNDRRKKQIHETIRSIFFDTL